MAEKKLRVHNLAKELDVDSKVIIEKCRAEGIEMKGHMDVVKAGLAATIREWFSEGAHTTTLEESGRIDLTTVKKPRSSKKKTTTTDTNDGDVAVLEPPVAEKTEEEADSEKKLTRPKSTKAKSEEPIVEEAKVDHQVAETVIPEKPVVTVAPESSSVTPEPEPAPQQQSEEALRPAASVAPAPVTPIEPPAPSKAPPSKTAHGKPPEKAPPIAGPQNVPKPAQVSGPRFVRMDKPEVIDRPRPSPRPQMRTPFRPPMGGMPPRIPTAEEEEETRNRFKGKGAKPSSPADVAAEKRPSTKKALRDEAEEVAEKLKEWRDRDLIERRDRLAHASGRGIGGLRAVEDRGPSKRGSGPAPRPSPAKKSQVELTEPILIKDFSRETGVPVASIIKKLMEEHGQFATVNTAITSEMALAMALEQGIELVVVEAKTGTDKLAEEFAAMERKHLQTRPPVVTVLGHVDHGKTTLLDQIRKTNVAKGEAGGITQHIGAYRVKVGDKWVAFLDTPGHTAFTAMRARGTNLTDVVVLVVAADDGVMPTTIEAINHAKAAKTPIVVALNKIDLPHDINKIFGQLAEHGLTPSGDWGGETDVVMVSAISGKGIDELLSHLATLSEVMELKADPKIPATGTVVEAHRDESLGNVARVLVQEGTLRPGDFIVCGATYGRVRAVRDEFGKNLKSAGPSTPVEVTGLSDVPQAGDRFFAVETSQRAKEIAEEAAARKREVALIRTVKPTNLEGMLASAKDGDIPDLPVIIKADMQGSVDVLRQSLAEFPSEQVRLNVIHAGVGSVTESDVLLAQASSAIIVAFHVVPEPQIQRLADGLGVDIRTYKVIYNLIDDVKKALEGLLTPDEKVESRGRAEVREVFSITRVGKVAGCFVREGVIQRSNKVRVIRDGVPVKDMAALDSLKRFKDDAKEVKAGFECGIRVAAFDDLKPGDIIEAFEVVKVARKLDN